MEDSKHRRKRNRKLRKCERKRESLWKGVGSAVGGGEIENPSWWFLVQVEDPNTLWLRGMILVDLQKYDYDNSTTTISTRLRFGGLGVGLLVRMVGVDRKFVGSIQFVNFYMSNFLNKILIWWHWAPVSIVKEWNLTKRRMEVRCKFVLRFKTPPPS